MIRLWPIALLLAVSPQDPPISFSDATAAAGLVEPLAGMMGHGGAWGDFDGDGRIDLFVGGFCDRPGSDIPSRLFRNRGDGTFELVRQVELHARTSGAVFADLDNDGALDLYVANNARDSKAKMDLQRVRSKLFRNVRGEFVETPLDVPLSARNAGVFDYDGDGLLDLLLIEDKFTRNPRSVLLHNMGGMKFEDSKLLPDGVFGLGCAAADLNGDGRPDFFIAHGNRLFISQKDGTYVEHNDAFAYKPVDGEDWPCGAAFGDLNRDGLLDLVVSDHHDGAHNRVYFNQGHLKFKDVTREVGLGDTVPVKCPHVEIQDFDNDGWPDIYMSAAWIDGDKVIPLIYRNEGGKFTPPRPIKGPMVYFPAGPSGDYDDDGRLDIFLVNWFEGNRCRLLHNDSPKRHWLNVRVAGRTMNRMGIGARVEIKGTVQEIGTGYGYASGQPAVCHFGLGDDKTADVKVTLPNGKMIEKKGVAADRTLVIEEQDDSDYLKPPAGLKGDFTIAKSAPQVDAVLFEDLPAGDRQTLWSSWGDGLIASNGKYYTAIGDHRGIDATSHVYEFDPATKKLNRIVNVAEAIGQKAGDYGHGKIHAALCEYDGGLFFATYWGKPREVEAAYGKGYAGSILLRYDLKSAKIENLGAIVPKQGLPASHFDPERALLYFHAVHSGDVVVYDLKERKVRFRGGGDSVEGDRAFMRDRRGRVYFTATKGELRYYDPDKNELASTKAALPGSLRAAARATKDGLLYGMTAAGRLFSFDPATETVKDLGPNFDDGDYTAVMVLSPDEKFLYFVPGAHGSASRIGTPVVQIELSSGRRKVLAFLNQPLRDSMKYNPGGTYNLQIDPAGARLFITFNGGDLGAKSPFGRPAVVLLAIPSSER